MKMPLTVGLLEASQTLDGGLGFCMKGAAAL